MRSFFGSNKIEELSEAAPILERGKYRLDEKIRLKLDEIPIEGGLSTRDGISAYRKKLGRLR